MPGRAFLRRLYAATANPKLKQHHHIRISLENRLDLLTWKFFLQHSTVYSRGFIQPSIDDAKTLDWFSDASRNFNLEFGVYCGPKWIYSTWNTEFCEMVQPSIEYLELFALTVGL